MLEESRSCHRSPRIILSENRSVRFSVALPQATRAMAASEREHAYADAGVWPLLQTVARYMFGQRILAYLGSFSGAGGERVICLNAVGLKPKLNAAMCCTGAC